MKAIYRARTVMVREPSGLEGPEGPAVRGPADVVRVMHELTDDDPQEGFYVFHLNTRHRVVGFEQVTRGTLDASLIHPRDVLRSAILSNAAAIVLAHNHPSGDATPSTEDRVVTRKLSEAAAVVGVTLLDHLVVGYGCHTSLASEIVS